MPRLTVYKSRVYLLGAYFSATKDQFDRTQFSNWNEQADLTSASKLSNVRPIPFTPIMVVGDTGSANNPPRLWGSNEDALICNLSYHDMPDPIQPEQEDAKPADDTDGTILRHHSPVHTLEVGQQFPLIMPTTKLIGQLADRHSGVETLADTIKQLYDGVPENELHTFTVSKVKLSQLAPAFVAATGEELTDEQQSYNDWLAARHAESKHLPEPGIIYGIVIPAVQALGVAFSSDLYIGAEVSLVKPVSSLDASTDEKEIVLAVSEATKPYLESNTDEKEKKATNPSAMFILPSHIDHNGKSIAIEDGYYLLRIKFWKTDYLKENTELNGHFPESIKTGRLKVEKAKIRSAGDDPQDVYTYELYEKVTFKSLSGFGQLACVCGDLISLEECLIYQFPESLPNYQTYTTGDTAATALDGTGIKTYSLFSAVQNYSISLAQGYAMGVNPFKKNVGRSIAKALWVMVQGAQLPPQITAGATTLLAFDAFQKSYGDLKDAMAERGSLDEVSVAKRLLRGSVADVQALTEALNPYRALYQEKGFVETTKVLSKGWVSGALRKKIEDAVPGIGNGIAAYNIYGDCKQLRSTSTKYSDSQQSFEQLALDYLQNLTMVQAYHNWAISINEARESLDLTESNEQFSGAHIVQDKSGIAIRLYFRFNNDEIPNENGQLRSDIDAACERLAALLKKHPDYKLRIDGHAGRIGSKKANVQVASQRAEHIKDAIVHSDSNPEVQADLDERIFAFSHGNSQPITSDDVAVNMQQTPDDSPLAIDRRVEVRVILPNYDITLPPSRTGMVAMERARYLLQCYKLQVEENKAKLQSDMLDLALGVIAASATILAPVALTVLVAKDAADIADGALSFISSVTGWTVYNDLKDDWKKKHQLAELAKTHVFLLKKYRDIHTSIEKKRLTSVAEVQAQLTSIATADELQKRFILRALALNGLVELMARISMEITTSEDPDQEWEKKLREYCVSEYIQFYVLNDNWEASLYSSNSFAQDWISTVAWFGSEQAKKRTTYHSFHRWAVHGKFNIGFPVQTRLYADNPNNGLRDFSKWFDGTVQKVSAEDIGFSRLLIMVENNGEQSWQPFDDYKNMEGKQRISPFTRVKIQVVLTKEASIDARKVFQATLSYGVDSLIRHGGPSFDLCIASRTLKDLTHEQGDELEEYFKDNAILSDDSKDSDNLAGHLKAVEFEPTYWFGDYQITGLKPLYPWPIDALFERWKSNGAAQSTSYYFALNDHKLYLENRLGEEMFDHLFYSIDSNHTWGQQRSLGHDGQVKTSGQPLMVYDGLFNQSVSLNEADLLVHDFVVSEAAQRTSGVPQYLTHQTGALCALEINGDYHWLDGSSKTSLSDFNWHNEAPMSIMVAVISNGTNQSAYKTMGLDSRTIQMKLALNIEEGTIWFFKDHSQGPNYFGNLVHAGEISFKKSLSTDVHGLTTTNYDEVMLESSQGVPKTWETFFAGVNSHIRNKPAQYLKDSTEHAQVHFAKFELNYVSPTGKGIQGLRPFGPILDKEDGKIDQSTIAIHGLYQEGLEPSAAQYSAIKPDSFEVTLPECSSFTEGVPWVEIESDASRADANAANYWREKMLGEANAQRRKEWLIEWIEKKPEIRVAPEPTTLAG